MSESFVKYTLDPSHNSDRPNAALLNFFPIFYVWRLCSSFVISYRLTIVCTSLGMHETMVTEMIRALSSSSCSD